MFDPTSKDRRYHRVGKKSSCGTIVLIAIIAVALLACVLVIVYLGGIAYIFENWPEIWAKITAFFAQ